MLDQDLKKEKRKQNIFLYFMLVSCLVVITVSFYFFYFKKEYTFFVEIVCNKDTENCFFKDCENNPDVCTPNNLSYYHQFTIKAKDFKYCLNENCTEACTSGLIECTKIECTESDIVDGFCVVPLTPENQL